MTLLERLLKDKAVTTMTDSPIFKELDSTPTRIPSLNIALSGSIDGGLSSGITVLAGPSKHFKSNMGLTCVKSYLDRYPDARCIYYDSEFGSPPTYIKSHGIDPDRIYHFPINDFEDLRSKFAQHLDDLKRGEKFIFFVDSVGNLASRKEILDAQEEKVTADMTRAKTAKSLFRIITPKLTQKNVPCVVIAHTYDTMEVHSKKVVSGGTGIVYSANTVIILGRQQDKSSDGTLNGYHFVMNVEKSRFVREKSKINFHVDFDSGINVYSGMLDLALECGMVAKPSQGWYQLVDESTGELVGTKRREADTGCPEFLGKVMATKKFKMFVENKYRVGVINMYQQVDDADDFVDDEDGEMS